MIHKRDTGQSFYPVELSDDLTQEVLELSSQKKNLEITLNEIRWPSIPVSDKQIKSDDVPKSTPINFEDMI